MDQPPWTRGRAGTAHPADIVAPSNDGRENSDPHARVNLDLANHRVRKRRLWWAGAEARALVAGYVSEAPSRRRLAAAGLRKILERLGAKFFGVIEDSLVWGYLEPYDQSIYPELSGSFLQGSVLIYGIIVGGRERCLHRGPWSCEITKHAILDICDRDNRAVIDIDRTLWDLHDHVLALDRRAL
jgi:hypothetical protein